MGKRKSNGMEQFNLGKWDVNEGKRRRKRKKKLGIEATIEKGKTDIEARNENVKAKHNSGVESKKTERMEAQEYGKRKRKRNKKLGIVATIEKGKTDIEAQIENVKVKHDSVNTRPSKKTQRMEAREYEHSDDDQEYVSFAELERISSDLEEIAESSEQLAEELGISSRKLEENSVMMAKNLVDTAKEMKRRLEVKNMGLDKVKSDGISKVIGEINTDFELIEHRSDYVAQKFKEISKVYRDLSTINLVNKSRRMRNKSNELRRRLEAMTIMAESGVEEGFLCKLGWAVEHEATEALSAMNSAMNKFKLSDEAYAILNEHQQILQDKSYQEQVLQIVLSRKEYKDYMKDLIVAKKENRKIGYIFLKEGRKAMSKMVMVRNIQEYHRIKTESQKIGTFPHHIVVPALPESVHILEHARTDRCTVLLYLNQDDAE